MSTESWRESLLNQGFNGYGYTSLERTRNRSWLSSILQWCGGEEIVSRPNATDKRSQWRESPKAAQTERLAALGEMQAEIIHEIKNPLAAMLLQAQLVQRSGANDAREFAERIEMSVRKIQKIIDGVHALARNSEADPFEPVSVGKVIEDATEISKWALSSKRIPLLVSATANDAMVKCRPTQICQVLVNLIHNARDAVENLSEPWIRISAEEKSDSVSLAVMDAGNGISPDVQKKLMEPFFTTKPAGKGTGLGLSISRQIVETHGGSLFLDTKAPHTCFRLELPKFPIPV